MSYSDKYIQSYNHDGRIGVLVELSLKGDSITKKMPEFRNLAKDIAMHIAACDVESVDDLLAQTFIKDASVTVGEHLSSVSAQLQETIIITRFVRWDDRQSPLDIPPPDRPAVAMRLVSKK